MRKKLPIICFLLAGIIASADDTKLDNRFDTTGFKFETTDGPFKPDKASFANLYRCPEWFRDAKFGIYMHWGLGSVPGFHGHHARHMYTQEEPEAYRIDKQTGRKPALSGYKPGSESVYQYHVARFGHPSKFGYKDFIAMWKAENFDAAALASLYKDCGAKFIGVMAVHHDNFDLWDSTHQPWNSVKMGPKLDIVGAWQQACRKEGLRFFVTTHLSNEWHEHLFYQGQADTSGPLKGVPYDTTDPKYEGLYGKRTPDGLRRLNPDFARNWYLRMKDLIDKYDSDLLYLDGGLPNSDYGLNMAAHLYNKSVEKHGKQEVMLAQKRKGIKGFTLDIEAAGVDMIMDEPFLVDTTLNPGWFYLGASIARSEAGGGDAGMSKQAASGRDADRLRLTAGQVISNLADIVLNPWLHGTGDFIAYERDLKTNKVVTTWAEFCNTWALLWIYEPPALFTAIARDRSKPFTHLGSARERIRYTIYQQDGYGIGSQCEFLENQNDGIYKEARRVMFKWVSDKRLSAFIPLQVNPQRPYNLKDNKPNSFGYGENPFTQVLQKDGTLVGITSVPEKYPHWKMYVPFSKDGAILKRIEKNDWVFCHGGPVLFAFRYIQPSYWAEPNTKENLDILQSDSRKNGWILDTAPIAAFAGGGVDSELECFSEAILTKSSVEATGIDSANPRFAYRSVNGHTLDITHRPHKVKYADQHKIDGKPVNYSEYPHFGSPWVQQPLGADKLYIRHGGKSLTYDFVKWIKTETNSD